MKYLYIVDYWVPFPASEYGGVINVIAEDDHECHDILRDANISYTDEYDHLIMGVVVKGQKYSLVGDHESAVVSTFIS